MGDWCTCKTLGRLRRWAIWVAIVDFPTQAVPLTRIMSGNRWWWNLLLPQPITQLPINSTRWTSRFPPFCLSKGMDSRLCCFQSKTCDLSLVPIILSCFHVTSIHHFQKSTGTYRIIPGHHLVAVNVLCSISTPLHKLHPFPISLACTKHSSHVENTLFKYQWIWNKSQATL